MSEGEDSADVVVVETSSFQLDGTTTFKPDVAVLLNITPDHLDRYGYSLENYAKSKWQITVNQTSDDYLVYNADDKIIADLLKSNGTKAKLIPVTTEGVLEEGSFGAGLNSANKNEFLIHTHNTCLLYTSPSPRD